MNLEYGHKCRADPVEAAIYSLEAKGEDLESFRGVATAESTVELEESATHPDKMQDHSSLELPVDFSKKDVAKVLIKFFLSELTK